MDNYEIELLRKIDNGGKLTRNELCDIIFEFEVERNYEKNRRWSRNVTTISQIGDRYFSTNWEEGLTEYQENEYYNQPIEVEMKTYEKTITITEWISVKK
ncbi:hypothetical protein [Clostridium sp. ZBS18]|uniref:hypothetical protein n=1 Tax=Clostridium sp. ZBS18 TaxID=2949967 RepID=UPI00207ABC28|nr:hypothetical protein [Clostridium sp. ZBS18]